MPRTPTSISPAARYPSFLSATVPACKSESVDEPPTALSRSSPGLRRHVCARCGKAFRSSGHLKRHVQTHTGEKNHPCPYPGCTTRCSRHDNLQQHYRLHLQSYITPRKVPKTRKIKAVPPTP
ncbi:hypothetical protein B0H13DRAFT_2214130, partial [Mycena leptocephala]